MQSTIKYKRFAETHNEKTLQEFFDRLISEGWEIIFYNEIIQPTGMLTNTPDTVSIHITVVCAKKQSVVL